MSVPYYLLYSMVESAAARSVKDKVYGEEGCRMQREAGK
jgi:hypothetical protein